jgi:hypothetical protein
MIVMPACNRAALRESGFVRPIDCWWQAIADLICVKERPREMPYAISDKRGMSMGLFDFIERISGRSALMEAMFARLGVRDWFAASPNRALVLRQAMLRCAACERTEECAQWLEAHDRADRAPEFCANRDLTDGIAEAMRKAS